MPAPDGKREVPTIFGAGDLLAGTYEVRALLGSGGMGQVFEAHDRALDRRVAIKAAWPEPSASPLRNEARALAAFRHASLPTVHTVGRHDGIDFIVMERIYGISLADELERRAHEGVPFGIDECLGVLGAIADGLAVVHAAGIAHRDVKPANVMLSADGRVVLMDFGLMLPEFEVSEQETVAGSPPYMAPEALLNATERGEGHLVDLYALGVVAYEMLVGHRPRAVRSLEHGVEQAAAEVPPLSEQRPDAPDRLARLVHELLAITAAERPQSAESVAWLLRSIHERDVAAIREGPVRVLVVEDEPDVARVLAFYAQKALGDARVRVVQDGDSALEQLRREPADVMLLDLHMPRMNGLEVCMYVRGSGLGDGMTIVPVTAGAEEHDRQVLHSLGIRHFLLKDEHLQRRVQEVLRQVVATTG